MEQLLHDTDYGALPLCLEEQEEKRLVTADDRRRRFIQTRSALRALLSYACNNTVSASEWRFTCSPGGKPSLEQGHGFPAFEFSIAHVHCITAIAIHSCGPVGIDIESVSISGSATIPWNVALCSQECDALALVPEYDRWQRFIRIWTAKEAYAKYLGRGFGLDFSGIQADLPRKRVTCCDTAKQDGAVGSIFTQSRVVGRKEYIVSYVIDENAKVFPRVYLLQHTTNRLRSLHG